MKNRKSIKDELNELGSNLPSVAPGSFSVPEGYFDQLSSSIMDRIRQSGDAKAEIEQLSPLLAGLNKTVPFSVPANYFNESLEALPVLTGDDPPSAILQLVEQVTPYQVPYNYFDELPGKISARVNTERPATRRRSWMNVAMAAVFAGIVAITGILYLNEPAQDTSLASQLENVSTTELDEFIQSATVVSGTETVQSPAVAPEVKSLMKDVDDVELEAFLNEVPQEDIILLN